MTHLWAVLAMSLAALSPAWAAEPYPNRLIRIIVPFSAGSSADLRTRQVAQHLARRFSQSVIVDNKPGASGMLGTSAGAKAAPDGYTLTFVNNSTSAIVPFMNKNVGYDVERDFEPVALMAQAATILVVNRAVAAKSLAELVGLAKAKPGALTYGATGVGGAQHLPMEMLQKMAGIDMLFVPFKGDSETLTSLLGGQIDMTFAAATIVLPQIRAEKIRALAVGGRKRLVVLPEVPTVAEAGYPEFEWHNWYGFLAPKGTPAGIIATLNREMRGFLEQAHVRQEYIEAGYDFVPGAPEDLSAAIRRDRARYSALIRSLGL